jgi:acyl-CoA reductase-like NAD-dependent aldehyde dehydrogenase
VRAQDFAVSIQTPWRQSVAESLVAEVLPLAEACRFLEREAEMILSSQLLSNKHRPIWLHGVELEYRREPYGLVLIIGPSNYPLYLVGVQALQALVAGNAVLIKPAPGCEKVVQLLKQLLIDVGLDPQLLEILSESPEAAQAAMEIGVDKVVLTGSVQTGAAVLGELAPTLTPATMELSGCDAVIVCHDADIPTVLKAIKFGLRFNSGATCIAPHRIFIPKNLVETICRQLVEIAAELSPAPLEKRQAIQARTLIGTAVAAGATLIAGDISPHNFSGPFILKNVNIDMEIMQSAVFAPLLMIIGVQGEEEAALLTNQCAYALGATIFGSTELAISVASKLNVGTVVINDMIMPTADPRLSFGGRGSSGFGLTRGAAGLLEMTVQKALMIRRNRRLFHLDDPHPVDHELFSAFLVVSHGAGWKERLLALCKLVGALMIRIVGKRRVNSAADKIEQFK